MRVVSRLGAVPGSRPRWRTLAKIAVSVGVLAVLFHRVDAGALCDALGRVRPAVVALAIALYAGGQLLSARKWALLAAALGFRHRFSAYVRLYFEGMFVNLLGPSTIGGDLVRALGLGGRDRRMPALHSVLADRALGLTVLVCIGLAALAAFPQYGLPWWLALVTGSMALLLVASWWSVPRMARLMPRHARVRRLLENDLASLWHDRSVLARATSLSVVFHLMEVTVEWMLARALGLGVPFSYCLILHPAVSVLAAVPVSVAGLGIREGGYAFFLERIGVSPAEALTFGILWFAVVGAGALPGGVLLWRTVAIRAGRTTDETVAPPGR